MADWNYPRPRPKIAGSVRSTGSDTVEAQPKGASMDNERRWIGRAVEVSVLAVAEPISRHLKPVELALTTKAARTLALALSRLKQTTVTLPGDAQELLTALDYVMVGDPASTRAHREMEAGKGMTPDGGYKAPDTELNPDRRTDGQREFNRQMGWME